MGFVGLARAWGLSRKVPGPLSRRCYGDRTRSIGAFFSSGATETGDRNVDIFDRVLKTKHVRIPHPLVKFHSKNR